MTTNPVNVNSTSKWHPDFLRSIDTAIEELYNVKDNLRLERRAALDAIEKAESEVSYVLVEWEQIPEGAADVIRGVLHEVRAMQKVLEDGQHGRSLNPDSLTGRLLDSIKGLEALSEF